MASESPLGMMQPPRQRVRPAYAALVPARRRRLWPILAPAAVLAVLALGWVALWYYAADVAGRTLAGWAAREAAAGRTYSCAAETIRGFPFRIEARCSDAAVALNDNQLHLQLKAKNLAFATQVYHPTQLIGTITAPVTVAELGRPPTLAANWERAQITVRGVPPDLKSVALALQQPRLDLIGAPNGDSLFAADHADLQAHIIEGSARDHPVIEATLKLAAATAPRLHASLAAPIEVEIAAVLSGFADLSPKPWPERFREMQASGGSIEIKSLRIARTDATVIGSGMLTVNAHGKLDGLIHVAIAGIDRVVPLLGIDQMIAQGVGRLAGLPSAHAQDIGASLDRLMPGLGGALRETANASVIETLKNMGQPTEIDQKRAIVLPLRFADGLITLGTLPLGEVPPLF